MSLFVKSIHMLWICILVMQKKITTATSFNKSTCVSTEKRLVVCYQNPSLVTKCRIEAQHQLAKNEKQHGCVMDAPTIAILNKRPKSQGNYAHMPQIFPIFICVQIIQDNVATSIVTDNYVESFIETQTHATLQ